MARPITKRSAAAGFTLIELMVTVLIAAILLTIAVPAYQTYIRKSRRTEAKTAVLDLAGREETLFSTTNNYSNLSSAVGYGAGGFPAAVGNNYYTVTVAVPPANAPPTFTVTAVPAAGSSQLLDTACQSFSVDQLGNQTALDAGGAVNTATCWGS